MTNSDPYDVWKHEDPAMVEMRRRKALVALFETLQAAHDAIVDLVRAGFTADQVGVALRRRDAGGGLIGETSSGEAEVERAADSGLGRLEAGLNELAIPGVGPVLAGGPLASMLGAGRDGIVAALAELGVSRDQAQYLTGGFVSGKTLVTVHAPEFTEKAYNILSRDQADFGTDWYTAPAPAPDLGSERTPERSARTVVGGLFDNPDGAQRAIDELKTAGFAGNQVGIAMRDQSEQARLIEDTGTRAAQGAATGAVGGGLLGGVAGFLASIGALAIPGVGPMIAGGTLAATLAGVGVGAVAGGIIGALVGLGIPEEEARYFETGIHAGRILLTVSAGERADEARAVLERNGADTGYREAAAARNVRHASTPAASDEAPSTEAGPSLTDRTGEVNVEPGPRRSWRETDTGPGGVVGGSDVGRGDVDATYDEDFGNAPGRSELGSSRFGNAEPRDTGTSEGWKSDAEPDDGEAQGQR